jgi:hypothetical protein
MQYFVKRGEEKYGPYSLAELQQYVQSGNIALTDMAQSEGMTDWAPISQVIGNVQVPQAAVYGAPTMESPMGEQIPLPPNLHWALLILINLFTRNFFSILVWSLIQANWARKLDKDNSTMILVAMYPAGIVAGITAGIAGGVMHSEIGSGVGGLLILGGAIASIVGCFKIKSAMEAYYNFNENIGLQLSGVMTFFFGSIYIQFHINRLARWKRTGVLN